MFISLPYVLLVGSRQIVPKDAPQEKYIILVLPDFFANNTEIKKMSVGDIRDTNFCMRLYLSHETCFIIELNSTIV